MSKWDEDDDGGGTKRNEISKYLYSLPVNTEKNINHKLYVSRKSSSVRKRGNVLGRVEKQNEEKKVY
jgi:hypothetical protein